MEGMDLIRPRRGLMTKIADELGITRGAVAMWRRVPAERVLEVERITGVSRHDLRSDLYPRPAATSADAELEAT